MSVGYEMTGGIDMEIWNFFNCCDVTIDIQDQYQDFYKNYWETYDFKLFTYEEYHV